ncbi:MAG TPA: serine/threonine-protein kinase [Kofleriaceae bacterium]|nr:serine/threonine-protein kinase [Kofleriaceae bacterium]
MASKDGDPPPNAASSAAFAATIAPADVPTPPEKLAGGTLIEDSGLEATVAAPASREPGDKTSSEPELVEVSTVHYQIDRELARGGMGKIVAAEDRRLHRRVALKQLLDPAGEHITRFQREALITARLQHPGIVPVYEAGRWPTGEPFFAMKLVSGRPLDKVIGEATRLEDRLAIIPRLAAACDAIAYAHSQRIIHRDLKPGNVLVGDFGETVVIDWGLAKDLDAADTHESANRSPKQAVRKKDEVTTVPLPGSSTLTVAGAVMGTPAYMAPEQARGEPLDQRADVFSLGAMLYHTLCGVPPYNARTATDVIAAAALGKIVPLREREKQAPADLVAIVDRAMAPSPYDRYPHAGELADELRRFLTGQLVGAHRYTASQRLARFVRKHRAAVTISAIAITAMTVGGTIAVRNIVDARDRARREEQIAVTRKQAAEHLIDYMFDEMKTRLSAAGRLDLLSNMGQEVKSYYAVLERAPGGMSREDEIRMAQAIDLIGASSRVSGKPDEALETWKQAREHLIAVVGNDKSEHSRRLRFMIAQFDFQEGRVFQERGKSAEAQTHLQRAEAMFDELARGSLNDKEILLAAAETHDHLGDLLRIDGKIDEAFEQYNEAKNEREAATSTGNGRPSVELLALSTSHFKLGAVFQNRGESGSALEEYRLALRQRQTLLEAAPDDVERQAAVLEVDRELADLQRATGDENAAIETYKEAIPLAEALVHRDPTNTEWQYQRGNLMSDLGYTLSNTGAYKDALVQLGYSIEVQKDLVARDTKSSRYKIALSRSHTRVGDAHLGLGKFPDALAAYRLALEIRSDLVDADTKNVAYRRSVAFSYAKLANAFTAQGNTAQALEAHEQAFALRKQLVAESPAQGGFKNELAWSEVRLARLLASSDQKRATALIKSGLDRARMLVAGDSINQEFKDTLTEGLLASATLSKAIGDETERRALLMEALGIAADAANTAKQNANWPGHLAEIHAGLAEHAAATGDAKTAKAEWKAVRDVLEPLAAADHLAATRRPLLERARAFR